MTGILLDTNAYVAFKKGDEPAVEVIRRAPRIVISSIVLGELRAGFAAGSRERQNLDELDAFFRSPRVRSVLVDSETSVRYAEVYHSLRSLGQPIPTNDIWIAATALQIDLPVFTLDAHFARVRRLRSGATWDQLNSTGM